jgi:single-strand DNA-binding protein
MNKVILIGRLTSDPELRQTQSGVSCCRFTIAVDRKFANKQTGEREADFISCQAWRNTAEFVSRYFTKGKMIAVEGSLRSGSYQDKNHPDVTHYTVDCMVDNVEFCGDKGNTNPGQAVAAPAKDLVQQAKDSGVETAMSYGDLSDFEEILSDGDCPF